MSKTCTISVDAGGSYIKSCLILEGGDVLEGSLFRTSSNSSETADKIIDTQIQTILHQLSTGRNKGLDITGISIAFPGPFDYTTGTFLMKHKYKAMYKRPLLPELLNIPELPDNCKIRFFHDLHAFVYGEYLYGFGRDCGSLLGVSLGTGLGTGLVINNQIIDNGKGGPAYPIFQKPYKNGTLEDFVSARGIVDYFNKLKENDSVEASNPLEIERMAIEQNDPHATETYAKMGTVLGKYIKPLIDSLQVECFVLGGQISKAYRLFGPHMEKELEQCNSLSRVNPSRDLDYIAFKGAAALLEKG